MHGKVGRAVARDKTGSSSDVEMKATVAPSVTGALRAVTSELVAAADSELQRASKRRRRNTFACASFCYSTHLTNVGLLQYHFRWPL